MGCGLRLDCLEALVKAVSLDFRRVCEYFVMELQMHWEGLDFEEDNLLDSIIKPLNVLHLNARYGKGQKTFFFLTNIKVSMNIILLDDFFLNGKIAKLSSHGDTKLQYRR